MKAGPLGLWAALVAVALGPLSPRPAVAEPDSRAVAAIVAACSPQGAFGETFGAKSLAGTLGRRVMGGRIVIPRSAYPPFEMFMATLTPNSERVAGVTALAELGDNDTALAWGRAILGAALQDPEQLSFKDAVTPYEPGAPQVSVRGQVLEVNCTDAALIEATLQETSEKPRAPHHVDIASPSARICERPEDRTALLAAFEETRDQHSDNLTELTTYILHQTGWLAQKHELEWRTAWLDVVGSPATSAARRAEAAHTLFEKARSEGDDASACAAAVQTLIAMDEAYKAQLAHLAAREAEIATLARSVDKETQGTPPNP